MKRSMLLLTIACLLAMPAMAQDDDHQSLVYGGVRFNSDQGAISFGYGTRIGGPVILLTTIDAGATSNFAPNFAAVFPIWKSLSFGVLSGPEADWGTRKDDDDSPTSYLVGAVGGIVSYELGKIGVCVVGKYRDDLKSTTMYEDGTEFGAALYVWF